MDDSLAFTRREKRWVLYREEPRTDYCEMCPGDVFATYTAEAASHFSGTISRHFCTAHAAEFSGKSVPEPEVPAMPEPTPFCPGVYRHYKGSLYYAVRLVLHTETDETLVVYRDASGAYFARPWPMWNEDVGGGPRFAWVEKLNG